MLEISLIVVTLGMSVVLAKADGFQFLILNLYFLPVALGTFILGRYRGAALALFCVISAGIVVVADLTKFSTGATPVFILSSLTVWGISLGLTSLLIGSLKNDLTSKTVDSQEAYIGVIEVLSKYLQSANPTWHSKSKRISNLCERIAKRLKLSKQEVENIRLASMLVDLENVEVTSRVIRKAVGEIDTNSHEQTFYGSELVHSIGAVANGMLPVLIGGAEANQETPTHVGAEVVRAAREFDRLLKSPWSEYADRPFDVLEELRDDLDAHYHPSVLQALEHEIESDSLNYSESDLAESV